VNRPKLTDPHRLQCIYCRQLRVCNVQMTCSGCESENAVWIEDPAGELRPLSATARSDCSGYYANEGAATSRSIDEFQGLYSHPIPLPSRSRP